MFTRKTLHTIILGLAFVFAGAVAMAVDNGTEAGNKKTIEAAFRGWAAGTSSPFDLLVPEARWTIVGNSPVAKTYQSKQEFIDAVITPFNARMKRRLIPNVKGLYADGDMVVVLFDAEAVAHDGKPYRNTYTWFIKLRNGKAVDVTAFFDSMEFADLW